MKILHGNIAGKFDEKHNRSFMIGDLEIVRADLWVAKHGDEETHTTFNENVNYLETKPQIFTVTHPSANHNYKEGDKLFVHYMAYETAERMDYGTVISTDFIFFKINEDESIELVDGLYLAESLYTPEDIRPSGIIIGGGKKEALKVRITHVPHNKPKHYEEHPVKIGDIVLTIDDKNYEFNYLGGKKYVKLLFSEIAMVVQE